MKICISCTVGIDKDEQMLITAGTMIVGGFLKTAYLVLEYIFLRLMYSGKRIIPGYVSLAMSVFQFRNRPPTVPEYKYQWLLTRNSTPSTPGRSPCH